MPFTAKGFSSFKSQLWQLEVNKWTLILSTFQSEVNTPIAITSFSEKHLITVINSNSTLLRNEPLLNSDQVDVYNFVIQKHLHRHNTLAESSSEKHPLELVKTFLLNLLLAKLQHNGDLAYCHCLPMNNLNSCWRSTNCTLYLQSTFQRNTSGKLDVPHNVFFGWSDYFEKVQSHCLGWSNYVRKNTLDTTMRELWSNNIVGGGNLLLAEEFWQSLSIIPKGT